MNAPTKARAYVGLQFADGSNSTPIKGVDGILGVVLMLSYYVGGTNIFPSSINPDLYVAPLASGGVETTDQLLSDLVGDCSRSINRYLKPLTLGSLQAYLSWLRNGRRPNLGVVMPAVKTSYEKSGRITIQGRHLPEDIETGIFTAESIPDWVYFLAEQKQLL